MSGERWTLLIDGPRPGWENMAIDSALLDLAALEGAAFLRLYRWEPHCLSFGRHEPAGRRYDRSRIDRGGIDCVRRPTGGRAVWHARELTYAVTAPLAAFGGLREAYHQIHALLAAAIAELGASPELAIPSPATRQLSPAAGPCFNAPVGGEVMLGGRKVVGSAQLRQGAGFLQHGSLLLEDDQSLVRALAGLPETGGAEMHLSRLLDRRVTFAEAAELIARCGERQLGPLARRSGLPPEALAAAGRHAERYRDAAWTWQR